MIYVMVCQAVRFRVFRKQPSPLIEIYSDGERFRFGRFMNSQALGESLLQGFCPYLRTIRSCGRCGGWRFSFRRIGEGVVHLAAHGQEVGVGKSDDLSCLARRRCRSCT
jgi:hypothetical protein